MNFLSKALFNSISLENILKPFFPPTARNHSISVHYKHKQQIEALLFSCTTSISDRWLIANPIMVKWACIAEKLKNCSDESEEKKQPFDSKVVTINQFNVPWNGCFTSQQAWKCFLIAVCILKSVYRSVWKTITEDLISLDNSSDLFKLLLLCVLEIRLKRL